MLEQRYRWKNKQLREHIEVLDGKRAPHILLKNATYLNQALRKWITANIWIYDDRIVYVGDKLPEIKTIVKLSIVQIKYLYQDILSHILIHFNYIIPIR